MSTEKLYCIARRSNMLAPAADRVRYAADYIPATGDTPAQWMSWGAAEEADRYTLAELGGMLVAIESARSSRYVGNGEASPDDLYIIPAEAADLIAARNADMGRYDWDAYTGPEGDSEAESAYCEACDVAEAEAAALSWSDLLAALPGTPASADEARRLSEDAGYSAEDAAGAVVLARSDSGAALYRVGADNYAIESGPGDICGELSAADAVREWYA